MAVIDPANLKFYLSGGAANADPDASLGGARSTTTEAPETLNGLFNPVTGDEAVAGSVKYRCVYFRNEDANANGLMAPLSAWVASQTTSPDTVLAIAIDPAGKNASAFGPVANEDTAPTGPTFSEPSGKGSLALPGAPYAQNDYVAIWLRRTVSAGASAFASDTSTIRVEGDTL
ncbi:MAG: hypothetical protein ACOYB2_10460 [Limnohabitans sp.]